MKQEHIERNTENLSVFKFLGCILLLYGVAHIISEIFFYDYMHKSDIKYGIKNSWCELRFIEFASIYCGYFLISGINKLRYQALKYSYDIYHSKEFLFFSKFICYMSFIVFMMADNFHESKIGIYIFIFGILCCLLARYILKKEMKKQLNNSQQ